MPSPASVRPESAGGRRDNVIRLEAPAAADELQAVLGAEQRVVLAEPVQLVLDVRSVAGVVLGDGPPVRLEVALDAICPL